MRKARKLMRGGVAAGLVAFGACGDAAHDAHGAAAMATGGQSASNQDAGRGSDHGASGGQPVIGIAGAAPASMPDPFLAPSASNPPFVGSDEVEYNTIARDVLWSWTTEMQVAELRANPVLLTRSETSNGVRTKLSTVIDALANTGDALAQVLSGGAFQKGRYAWTNAWATLRGWPGESYGDQLLRIVLKPESLIVVLDGTRLQVIDMENQPVPLGAALGTPERIAAVYYVNPGDSMPNACGSLQQGCGTGAFREYFINNESMVQEWSLGTQAIRDELERSIDLVQALRDAIGSEVPTSDPCEFSRRALCAWSGSRPSGTFGGYVSGMAITSDLYAPTPTNMDALLNALKAALFEPDPFVHEP